MRKDLEKKKEQRIGEVNKSIEGYEIKIIKYNGRGDIIVEFQDKYKANVHTSYQCFKNGQIKNPNHPSVYFVGYIGQGIYTTAKNGRHTKIYNTWVGLLERCYNPYCINKNLSYKDCFVCEEWHNYQNFAKWYEENYYEILNEKMHLDKDILIKGNKIYSPETCLFVPQRINELFTKCDRQRGEFPIGVGYHKRDDVLLVQCSIKDREGKRKNKHLGYFPLNKPFQAFYTYKIFKEQYVKQVADEYKHLIPQKLYEAMYNYEVEIND